MTNQTQINQAAPAVAPKKKVDHKYTRDKHREMVKGKFIFHEVPGGLLSFPFREFKEDEVERYDLYDGEIYTLPLGVAKHLNKNCAYPEYEYIKGEPEIKGGYNSMDRGKNMRVCRMTRRCSFQSLEFLDLEDVPNRIVMVEKV